MTAMSTMQHVETDGDDWVADFFRAADTFQLERLTEWFADDIEVRFGNAPVIKGKADATDAFHAFWETIDGMRHERESLVVAGDQAAQMSLVTYLRKDGNEIGIPAASHLRRSADGRVDRLWIYIDMAPLFAVAM